MNSMKIFVAFILALITSTVFSQTQKFSFKQFEPKLHLKNDTTYVINFWATWCVPCRKEMPAFVELQEKYKNKKLKILLVSLDFPNQADKLIFPFKKKYNIQSEIILLNDPDSNSWIDKVDNTWSGAIPATLVYNARFRKFYEQSFTYDELESIVKPIL
ncbi:MAG: TlpA family protein disulfide reductase [Bacteroidales bacterium]|nr:TlpA family protein disulfide reductase [Bacteroidales bacterium]